MQSNRSQSNRNYDSKRIGAISPNDSKLEESEYKYLPLITRVSQEQLDQRWQECKIHGKNLLPRSNSSIAIHNTHLYLFGGYQFSWGIMKDFYQLNLNTSTYYWQAIHSKFEPGPHCRHTMCCFNDKIYLFGGQIADSLSTNSVYIYNLNSKEWELLEKNNTYPPPLDNHAATIYNNQWIIYGGFYGQKCQHSKDIYSFDFLDNKWMKLNQKQKMEPCARDGSAIICYNDDIFMFGGKNGDLRYNDLWKFNLINKEWLFIANQNLQDIPQCRSGHSLTVFNNKIILFGGIHDVTWELDDLYVFNIDIQEWKTVTADTSRRSDQELLSPGPKTTRQQQNKKKPRRLTLLRPMSLKKSPRLSPPKTRPYNQSRNSSFSFNQISCDFSRQNSNVYAGNNTTTVHTLMNNVQERKRQEQLRKKAAMLKLFEVQNIESMDFQDDCNVTEKLKTSIILTGNPKQDLKIKTGILTEFGRPLISRFLLPLAEGQNTINGRKPCARDGHSITLFNNYMLVFGGDRHTMSFNDLYLLDMNQL